MAHHFFLITPCALSRNENVSCTAIRRAVKYRPVKIFLTWAAVLALCLPCLGAETESGLQPIYLLTNGATFRLSTEPLPQQASVAFQAICTNQWLPGLVPIFAVQAEERFELRRRPVRGQGGSSEPMFFALPNPDEPEAARIAGRWDCIAIRGDGSKAYLAWELSPEGHSLAGRFDQNTDYRFAHINGGSFRSNRLELHGEYISDAFILTGTWEASQMKGEWHRTGDSERGTWEATRPFPEFKPPKGTVPLYEWRNPEGKRRYAIESKAIGKEWGRKPKPLCHVWR
jgi:hypothetical protein